MLTRTLQAHSTMHFTRVTMVLLAVVAQDTLASTPCNGHFFCSISDIGNTIASQVSKYATEELQMVLTKLADRYPGAPFFNSSGSYEQSWASPVSVQLPEIALQRFTLSTKVPLIGDFNIQVSDVLLAVNLGFKTAINVTGNNTQLLLGFPAVSANASFSWSWSKLGLTGSGTGQLALSDGEIAYLFHVGQTSNTSKLYFSIEQASSKFQLISLDTWSPSANWLYQIVIQLFSSKILGGVQSAVDDLIQSSIPAAVNDVLATSPYVPYMTGSFTSQLTTVYSVLYVVGKAAVTYLLPSSCNLALINSFSVSRMPDNMSPKLVLDTILHSISKNDVQLPENCTAVQHQAVAMLPLLVDALKSVGARLSEMDVTPHLKACILDLRGWALNIVRQWGHILGGAASEALSFNNAVSKASQLWQVVWEDQQVPGSCAYLIKDDEAAVFSLTVVVKLAESFAPVLLGLDLNATDPWTWQEVTDGVKGAITPEISALWSPSKAMVPQALLCAVKMPAVVYNALTDGSPTLLSQLQGLGVLPTAPEGLEPVATCVEDVAYLVGKALDPFISMPTNITLVESVMNKSSRDTLPEDALSAFAHRADGGQQCCCIRASGEGDDEINDDSAGKKLASTSQGLDRSFHHNPIVFGPNPVGRQRGEHMCDEQLRVEPK